MNNDETNKSSIDELVTYADDAEDTDYNTPDIPDEDDFDGAPPPEPSEEEDDYGEEDAPDGREYQNEPPSEFDGDEYEEDDEPPYYDDEYDYDENDDDDRGKSKIKKIAVIAVILAVITAICAVLSIDTGIIATYKKNFANNFSRIFGIFTMKPADSGFIEDDTDKNYNTSIRASVIVSDGVRGAQTQPYKDGVVCASSNHISYIDASGNTVWSEDMLIVDPILSVRGGFILVAERGGKKLCLYNDSRMLYEADDPDNIIAAKVSSAGDSVLITSKAAYKGGISVYNKLGEQIYSWASGSGAVISADISPTSRSVAVALLNTETTATSVIQFFNIKEEQSYAQVNAENTVMFDLCFNGSTLTAFGDNRLAALSDKGGVISDNDLTNFQITHSAADGEGGGTALTLYDNAVPKLALYDKNGKEQKIVTIDGMPDFVDIKENTVLYNIGRDIFCGKAGAKNITKYTAAMDIKELILISQNTFAIVYSNSIELVKI